MKQKIYKTIKRFKQGDIFLTMDSKLVFIFQERFKYNFKSTETFRLLTQHEAYLHGIDRMLNDILIKRNLFANRVNLPIRERIYFNYKIGKKKGIMGE